MPAVLSTLNFNSAPRIRGLIAPVNSDEPLRLGDPLAAPVRRVLSNPTTTGSFTCEWDSYDEIRLTLVGDTTLTFNPPSNGRGCVLTLKQDATGSRGIILPGTVRFSDDIPGFTVTLALADVTDRLGFIYDAGANKYDFVSVAKGFL